MGTHIQYEAYECLTSGKTQFNDLWPRSPLPSHNSIKSWQEFLRLFCCTESVKLLTPLTHWLHPISENTPHHWNIFFHEETMTVCIKLKRYWKKYDLGPLTCHGHPILHHISRHAFTNPPDITGHTIADCHINASGERYIIPTNHFYFASHTPQPPQAHPLSTTQTGLKNIYPPHLRGNKS